MGRKKAGPKAGLLPFRAGDYLVAGSAGAAAVAGSAGAAAVAGAAGAAAVAGAAGAAAVAGAAASGAEAGAAVSSFLPQAVKETANRAASRRERFILFPLT